MAAVVVTAQNIRLDDAEATTDWGNIGGGPGGGLETDFKYQGSNCFARKGGSAQRGIYLSDNVDSDLSGAGAHETVMFKFICTTPGLLDLISVPGMRLEIGSGSTPASESANFHFYDVQGSDTYPVDKSWLVLPINPNIALHRSGTTGTPVLTLADFYGLEYDQTAVSKSPNQAMDAVDIGSGLTLAGGDGGDADGVWQDFSDHDFGTIANRYGYIREIDGAPEVFLIFGQMVIGTSAATVFNDTAKTLIFPDGLFAAGFSGITIDLQNATTDIDFIDSNFFGKGIKPGEDTRALLLITGTSGDFDADGCVFDGFSTLTMTSAATLLNCTISNSEQIILGGGTLDGCLIFGATPTVPPAVAFFDSIFENLERYEFDGLNWNLIGNSKNISGAGAPAVAALSSTRVAFFDELLENLETYDFDGLDWTKTGNSKSLAGSGFPALAALSSTRVAILDGAHDNLEAYDFDGTDWTLTGNSKDLSPAGFPALAALSSTRVAVYDTVSTSLATYEFDDTDWIKIGNDKTITGTGSPALAALSDTRVAFFDGVVELLEVYEFDGLDWIKIGNSKSLPDSGFPALATLSSNSVALFDATHDNLEIYEFDGLDWTQVGNSKLITDAGFPALAALSTPSVGFIITDTLAAITSCDFIFSSGHAIEITAAGTYAFVGNQFTGYGADETSDAAIFNNSGGLVTINISDGGSTPTIFNGLEATTVINNNVSLTFSGMRDNTEVRVFTAGTTTELDGIENATTGTADDRSVSFSLPANIPVDVRFAHGVAADGRRYTVPPANSLSLTWPSTTSDLPVTQVLDRNFFDPV